MEGTNTPIQFSVEKKFYNINYSFPVGETGSLKFFERARKISKFFSSFLSLFL